MAGSFPFFFIQKGLSLGNPFRQIRSLVLWFIQYGSVVDTHIIPCKE